MNIQQAISDRTAGSKPTDIVTALAMACLAATQRYNQSVDLAHKNRAFAHDFRDEDLPPPQPVVEEAELSDVPLYNGEWWRWKKIPRSTPSYSADDRLRSPYGAIDNASKWGMLNEIPRPKS